jgi:hypothetical protein
MSEGHAPVLLQEMLEALAPRNGAHYIDGTFGGGGYSRAILESADCRVLGIDRDPDAIARGAELVTRYAGRLTLVEGRFSQMDALLETPAKRAATESCSIWAFRRSSWMRPSAAFRSATTARSTCAWVATAPRRRSRQHR